MSLTCDGKEVHTLLSSTWFWVFQVRALAACGMLKQALEEVSTPHSSKPSAILADILCIASEAQRQGNAEMLAACNAKKSQLPMTEQL